MDEIERLPGAESVAAIEGVPLTWFHTAMLALPGRADQDYLVQRRHLTPGYFRTMGIPLLAGREAAGHAPRSR